MPIQTESTLPDEARPVAMPECDVLIIGAGPVGTALALELALHRVSFRIIDQCPVRSDKSRALVVQSRTLELLNRLGAAQELASRGAQVHGTEVNIDRKFVAVINLDDAAPDDAEFPLPIIVSQAETERFLDECLAKFGASVERPVTAKSITQDETGVTTKIEGPDDDKEIIRSKYVVGCDGAHSIVRHSAKALTFEGAAYPQDFALCDAKLRDSNLPQDRLSMHFGFGMFAVVPLGHGLLRFLASGNIPAEKHHINAEGDPTLDYFQKALQDFTPPGSGTIFDPVWISRFRLHHRGVNKYRDGRLFLAGDAAHIHSPAGGQGMNTGMQDAYNLGWKLAAVINGTASEALLDSYHDERHPIGQQLLRGTDRLFTFAASHNWLFVRLRNLVLPWILPWLWSSRDRTRVAYQFISELGINYRGSRIVGTARGFQGPVAGGDRVPDGELRRIDSSELTRMHRLCIGSSHHLLLFSGSSKDEGRVDGATSVVDFGEAKAKVQALLRDDIKTHIIWDTSELNGSAVSDSSYLDADGVVHARYGLEKMPGYVLARPDGYIAHIGPLSRLGDLLSFLESYLCVEAQE